MRNSRLLVTMLVSSGWLGCCAFSGAAAPGVTDDAVTFGQTACMSGPCMEQGMRYRAGILAAFHERNRDGGVDGRELKLVSRDDGYVPDHAAENARWFADSDEVLAVVGGVGTPTARRVAPILRGAGIPFVGHLTGAGFLSDARRFPNVVNMRTGYAEETRKLVAHMVEAMGARRFGIVYQDDSFGRSILASFKDALAAFDLPILAKASYSRHTHAIHASVFVMERADLDAVLFATVPSVSALAINTARTLGHRYIVGLLSVVEADRLRASLGHPGVHPEERILVARVTPDMSDDGSALVRRFRRAYSAYIDSEPEAAELVADRNTLEGYILGRFVVEVLRRLPDEPAREAFLETALTGEFVIDDWVIAFEEGSNIGSDYVHVLEFADHETIEEAVD